MKGIDLKRSVDGQIISLSPSNVVSLTHNKKFDMLHVTCKYC